MGGGFHVQLYRPGDEKVADLLLEQGRIAAQRAAASGQIWGNALSNVGQNIGQTIADAPKRRLEESRARREEASAARQEAQLAQQAGDQSALDKAYSQPGVDPAEIEKSLIASGRAHLIPAFRETWGKQQEQTAKYEKAVTEAHTAQSDLLANGARYLKNHLADPDGGIGAATTWVQTLPKNLQQAAGPYMQQVQQNPGALSKILDDLIGQSPSEQARLQKEQTEEYTLGPGQVRFKGGKQVAAGGPKEETRSIDDQLAAAKLAGDNAKYGQLLRVKSEAAFAGRAPKQPSWQQGEDTEGNPILYDTASGAVKPFPSGVTPKAGAAEAGRIAGAKAALEASSEIRQYLSKPEVRKAVGPLIGRYNSLAQAAGVGDPVAVELVGMLKSYAAMQPNIHGFRAVHFASDIEKLLSTKQTPESLEAALRGIDTAAINVRDRGRHPAGATAEGPKQIKSDSDYASLPSGAEFIDPEGKRRRKP